MAIRLVLIVGLASTLGGCAGTQEYWVRDSFEDVRYDDAFQVVRDVLDRDYALAGADPVEGRIETRWSEESITPYYRFATRERVIAHIERVAGQPEISLRVARQKALARNPMKPVAADEWDDDDDDPTRAEILLQSIQAVLGKFGVSDKFRERMERRKAGVHLEGADG